MVWAFASLDYYAVRLFEDMAEIVIARTPGFVNQGLVNILWAYAKVGHKHEEMFDVVWCGGGWGVGWLALSRLTCGWLWLG